VYVFLQFFWHCINSEHPKKDLAKKNYFILESTQRVKNYFKKCYKPKSKPKCGGKNPIKNSFLKVRE
jgi:hypothetical protein